MNVGYCRDEILICVKQLLKSKTIKEFTIQEVIELMRKNSSIYKESTIRTHISSKCCVNSPSHHATVYSDFQRVRKGVYILCN